MVIQKNSVSKIIERCKKLNVKIVAAGGNIPIEAAAVEQGRRTLAE
jgi:hypothetical protein